MSRSTYEISKFKTCKWCGEAEGPNASFVIRAMNARKPLSNLILKRFALSARSLSPFMNFLGLLIKRTVSIPPVKNAISIDSISGERKEPLEV